MPYLDSLGITDLYLSPILKARHGSTHGYDVVDPTQIDPALGTEEQFEGLARQVRVRGMGILLDVVPNHMSIADLANRWWTDVLENGPSSPYAPYFDIDWHPPKSELADKVLLPVLGDQYGKVLEAQDLRIVFEAGAFHVQYYGWRLPLAPRTSNVILESALERVRDRLDRADPHVYELESIITATGYLPLRTETAPERIRERQREKEVIKRRIGALAEASREVRDAIESELGELNGRRGDPRSFDQLEALLAEQAYRLCHWRVAADEVNYRRFFDINELAAIRVEDPNVFKAVHEVIFRFVRRGWITGMRIDHVDGLYDPVEYLRKLQEETADALGEGAAPGGRVERSGPDAGPFYVIVEKILGRRERLHSDWPVAGTTGYDFMNQLNGLFIDRSNERSFRERYARFIGRAMNFGEVVNTAKKLIMLVAMASELRVLAWALDRISEQHRYSRDFTQDSLRFALREVIAAFPVYRSYIRAQGPVDSADRRRVRVAIEGAKRRNPATDPSLFDFIGSVLLREDPNGLSEDARSERTQFIMRFQQLTSPVMAKGLEDTAFYRYFPLASLNEVGGDTETFGLDEKAFHRANQERLAKWPDALLATSTHDTKRSEDVRARLNVLSEIPGEFFDAVRRWHKLTSLHRTRLASADAPDRNDEYLIYQTLAGVWPLGDEDRSVFQARVKEYMIKATREAKVHTSWIKPDESYEEALLRFIDGILEDSADNAFLAEFRAFHSRIAFLGAVNSLAQVLIKITSPGVPDIYQGTELFCFTLVDPDNRRPVDFSRRTRLLADIDDRAATEGKAALAMALMEQWRDGAIKLFVTAEALRFRRAHRRLFESGEYVPLTAAGRLSRSLFGFRRELGSVHALVLAPRLLANRASEHVPPLGERFWGDSRFLLPSDSPTRWRNVFTGENLETSPFSAGAGASQALPAGAAFARLPIALLESIPSHAPDKKTPA
jgi:(1->4)-alpha-D-glucan 1-alpha-D-glucosylmutase